MRKKSLEGIFLEKVGIILLFFLIIFGLQIPKQDFANVNLSSEITIINVDEPYEISLLVPRSAVDSYSDSTGITDWYRSTIIDEGDFPLILLTIDDQDYISALLYYGALLGPDNVEPNVFLFRNAPQISFKIIIIFDDNHYLISNAIDAKLNKSRITWDLTDENTAITSTQVGTVSEQLPYGKMVLFLVLSIFTAITIKMLVMLAMLYKKKESYKLAFIVNGITQIVLIALLFIARYSLYSTSGIEYIVTVGGILVILIEMFFYGTYLKENSENRAMAYAFISNLASVSLLFIISIMLPLV